MRNRKTAAGVLAAALLLTGCRPAHTPALSPASVASQPAVSAGSSVSKAQTAAPTEPAVCAALVERFAISADNPYVSSPIAYTIDNEKGRISLQATYDRYVDLYTLKNCRLDIALSEGAYALDGAAVRPDGRVDLTQKAALLVTDSRGVKKTYTITTDRTVYDLPIVNIYLEQGKSVDRIDRNAYTPITFSIDVSGAAGFEGTDIVKGAIRGRGHSTWKWEKKPYKVKLDQKASILGLPADREWILLANYSDKSLMRNTVAYDMSRALDGMDWSPSQYPVDLFVNGAYRGVYSIGEHMKIAEGRVNMEKDSPDEDTGFLLELGGVDDPEMKAGVDYFALPSDRGKLIAFKDPDGGKLTDGQRRFITEYVGKADKAIVSEGGYEAYIDVDSFCDWILLHELTYNSDSCFRRSCYLHKDRGGKLKMGPVWDFDLAFGNCNKDTQSYDDWVTVGKDTEDAYVTKNWCTYLMADKAFRSRIHDRWFGIRDRLVSAAQNSIEANSGKIQRSQQENFKVWKIWDKKAGYQSWNNTKYKTYPLQVQYLRDFIAKRAAWIDGHI